MLKAQLFIRKNVLYVRFNGELDQSSVESIKIKVSELIINYKIVYLVINCSNLTFMDSSGIGFILGRYNQLNEIGGEIVLCELNQLCERIVKISGVSRIVSIKKTEKEAEIYVEGKNEKTRRSVV